MLLKKICTVLTVLISTIAFFGNAIAGIDVKYTTKAVIITFENKGEYFEAITNQNITSFVITSQGLENQLLFYQTVDKNGRTSPMNTVDIDRDGEPSVQTFSDTYFSNPTKQIQLFIYNKDGTIYKQTPINLDLLTFQEKTEPVLTFGSKANASTFVVPRSAWGANDYLITEEGWNKERDTLCKTKSWYCAKPTEDSGKATREKFAQIQKDFPYDSKISETIKNYSDGKSLFWNVNKSDHISKLFVHHTAELNKDQNSDGKIDQADEKIVMRNTLYYHTIVRGWGDIGYNYVIGPTGTIYEGRYGGDKAVGAHAVWRNISSIGVSVMGNFQEEYMTDNQKKSLVSSLSALAGYYGLNPASDTLFYGITQPVILGHKDSDEASTACPGAHIYDILPDLRKSAAISSETVIFPGLIQKNPGYLSRTITTFSDPVKFKSGETKTMHISLANIGTEGWDKSTALQINAPKDIFAVESGEKSEFRAANLTNITKGGGTAEFDITLTAGMNAFKGNIELLPIANSKFMMTPLTIPTEVTGAKLAFEKSTLAFSKLSFLIGSKITGSLTIKNTGDTVWKKAGKFDFHVNVVGSTDNSAFNDLSTLNIPNDVNIGEVVTLPFTIDAPLYQGSYFVSFVPKVTNYNLLLGQPVRETLVINHPVDDSSLMLTLESTTDVSLAEGSKKDIVITVNNNGDGSMKDLSKYDLDIDIPDTVKKYLYADKPRWAVDTLGAHNFASLVVPIVARAPGEILATPIRVMLNKKSLTKEPLFIDFTIKEKALKGTISINGNQTLDIGIPSFQTITLKNMGSTTWPKGTLIGIDTAESYFYNSLWQSKNIMTALPSDLLSQGSYNFVLPFTAKKEGRLIENFVITLPSGDHVVLPDGKLIFEAKKNVRDWIIPLEFGGRILKK